MLTVELRVNGSLIKHIYIVNVRHVEADKYLYRYEIYEVDSTDTTIYRGRVHHHQSEGALRLLERVLADWRKKVGNV